MKVDRRANRYFNSKSCGIERAETEVEVMPIIQRTVEVFDQNSAVYHDAAETNPQIDVSVLWTTADKVLKLQRKVQNYEPVARFHNWRTELINACAQAFVTPSTAHVFSPAVALPQSSKAQIDKHLPTVFDAPHTIEVVDAKETLAGIDVTRSTTV